MRNAEEPVRIADVVPVVMKKLGIGESGWLRLLADDWAAIVGQAVAAHTRPGRLDGGRLTVFVDSAAWLSELSRYGRENMLANVQKRFGTDSVKSVLLRADPGEPPGGSTGG